MTEPSEPSVTGPSPLADWLDLLLRVAGAVIGVWGGVLLSFYGAFLTGFKIGTVLVPISLVLAIAGNILLIWFTYQASGHKFVALIPSLVWVVLSFVASSRTTEGDLVLVDSNWVSVVYLLAGSITIGLAAYRLILPRRR